LFWEHSGQPLVLIVIFSVKQYCLTNNRKEKLIIHGRRDKILASDKDLAEKYKLVTSVPGIGRITFCYLAILSMNFRIILKPNSLPAIAVWSHLNILLVNQFVESLRSTIWLISL